MKKLALTFAPLAGGLAWIATMAISGAPAVASASPPSAFNQCVACHSVEPGKMMVGPSLAGVVGGKSGTVKGFAYSPAMRKAGKTWTEEELDTFLSNPIKTVPGTKMPLPVRNPAQRKAIIDYLKTI